MLCQGKSLVVILNYALTAEQPDPCGPEPCSPGRAAPDPLPAWGGSGDTTYPGGGSPQPKQLGPPDPPGSPRPLPTPDPICYPDPSAGREQTPRLVGSGAATCPQAQARARPRSFLGKTRPPTAFNAVDEGALCRRARGDFCQAVLLTARYQGAQCSRWCHPRHARQSATLVRHNSSATEYHNSYEVDPQSTPQPTLPQRAPHRWERRKPPRSESLQDDEAYPARDSPSL